MIIIQPYLKWFLLSFIIINSSCNNGLYNPVNENIDPAITHGDVNLSFNTNISDYYIPQAGISFSPIDKFNLTYNTFQGFAQKSHTFSIGHYFKKLDESTSEISSSFLLNLGGGFGENTIEIENYSNYNFIAGKYFGNYTKLFLQLGYHKKVKSFDFNFSTRAVYLDWYKLTFIYSDDFSYGINPLPEISANDPYHFQEFTLRITANRNAFKVFTLMNIRAPLFDNDIEFHSFNIGVGCSIKLNELLK